MKSEKEIKMEKFLAELRRLQRELDAAFKAYDKAWKDYTREVDTKITKPLPSRQGIP